VNQDKVTGTYKIILRVLTNIYLFFFKAVVRVCCRITY